MSRCIACDHDLVGGNCPIHGDLTARAEQTGTIRLYQDENGDYHRGIAIEAAASVPAPEQDEAVRLLREALLLARSMILSGERMTPLAAAEIDRALATPPIPAATHGRHCPCSACAREDWTNPGLAPCGMHGPSCPPVYAPVGAVPAAPPLTAASSEAAGLDVERLREAMGLCDDLSDLRHSPGHVADEYARLRPDQEDGE